jgi:hypothetical protein
MPEGREPKATAYDKSRSLYFKYNQRQVATYDRKVKKAPTLIRKQKGKAND